MGLIAQLLVYVNMPSPTELSHTLENVHCEKRCILLVKEEFDLIAVHIGGKLNLV